MMLINQSELFSDVVKERDYYLEQLRRIEDLAEEAIRRAAIHRNPTLARIQAEDLLHLMLDEDIHNLHKGSVPLRRRK